MFMLYASEQEIYVQAHSNLLKCATAGYQMGNGRHRHPFPDGIRQPTSVCLKSKKCIMPSCRGAIGAVGSSAKTLVVSYIGLQTQTVTIKPNLKIMMKSDSEMLDEVMVVAYGTAKKSSFTGSASVVSGEKISKMQTSNVSKSLEGAMAGVQISQSSGQPGSSGSIYVRGLGSISAGKEALIVVDGVPYEGSLNQIAPNDIESMTVLKDAAANSLYGARGANGVVLITTKKGKTGKAKVVFENRTGVNMRGVPSYDVLDSPAEYPQIRS